MVLEEESRALGLDLNDAEDRIYVPSWHGAFEGYSVNQAKKHVWRVGGWLDIDDLVQEAWIIFDGVCKAYAGEVVEDKHFMSLYQTSLRNRFHRLASNHTRDVDPLVSWPEGMELGSDRNAGAVLLAIESAPKEIRQLFDLMFNAPEVQWRNLIADCHKAGMRGAGYSNQFFCALLGLNAREVNIPAYMAELLSVRI